jgi:hypothetical protein
MSDSKAVALTEERKTALDRVTSYGKRESTKSVIIGKQLKFQKGEWTAGRKDDEVAIPLGTKLVFNLDWTTIGWQYWEDGKVIDSDMGLLIEGFQPKPRGMLSLPTKEEWPVDDNGFRKDPWAKSTLCLLKEPGKKGQVYTLAIGSKGGQSAMGELLKKAGEEMRTRMDSFPVIVLGVSGYKHKRFGWVPTPAFKICGWVPMSDFDVPLIPAAADEQSADFGGNEDETESSAPEAKSPEKSKKATPKQAAAGKAKTGNGKGRRSVDY